MTTPVVARTRVELAAALGPGRRVLVPTMGALHEGHASLMRTARALTDGPLVVSVFVNPLQFGAGEDLDRYPRTMDEDLKLCEREGVDVVFAPTVAEVYPGGVSTGSTTSRQARRPSTGSTSEGVTVEPGPLAEVLEGRTRPGHFRGVLTVVAKLFGLVRPDVAVFGEKDYQQLVLIRRMVADLCLAVDIVGVETERETDGLALSSRNRYLDDGQRRQAVVLNRALRAAQDAAAYGVEAALEAARSELRRSEGLELDYLEITDPHLGPATPGEARVLIAARVGTTRLIDNLPLHLGGNS